MNTDLRQTINVGFAGAKIAALHCVVEKAENAVAIVLVILGRVDAALRRDGMGAPWRILETKAANVIAQFAKTRSRGRARQAGADNNDGILTLISRIHQLHFKARAIPLTFYWTGGYTRIRSMYQIENVNTAARQGTLIGIEMYPATRMIAIAAAPFLSMGVWRG